MAGFGSSQRVFEDPHVSNASTTSVPEAVRTAILTALYRQLGLTRIRPVLDSGVETENDDENWRRLDPDGFDFSGKRTDSHVALVDRARRVGLRVALPGPVVFERWMNDANPEEYTEWAMAVLTRWRTLGVEPEFYSPVNEPGWTLAPRSAAWLRRVVRTLGARMRTAGLRTRLVVPDDLNAGEAYGRAVAVLSDPIARRYVGALAYHLYGGDENDRDRIRELARRYGLPVWMTEYSQKSYRDWPGVLGWATTIQDVVTRGGVSAVDYMWGFIGDYSEPDGLISVDFDDGVYRGHSLTPAYYVTGQFSRFIRPGDRRVAATALADGVLTSAFVNDRGRLTVVMVNPSHSVARLTVRVRGKRLRGPVAAVRTSASESWKGLEPVVPRGGDFMVTLPPLSVTTFVARTRSR